MCDVIDNHSERAEHVRNKWRYLYSVWRKSIANEDVRAILDRFLSTHEESPTEKTLGDKYGRIIDGWNEDRQEPRVVYSTSYFLPGTKHNINGIPLDYYRTDCTEQSIQEEKEELFRYLQDAGIDMSAYEEDEDGLPF